MKCRWVLPAFLLAALVLRASSLFRSVVDWDESLYLLMARSMLEGNAPYTAIWNNTPPGIYAIFASVLAIFPNSIPAIRMLTCAVVGLTSLGLYRLGVVLSAGDQSPGLMAGGFYVLYSASPAMGGLASNTELFYTLLTVWAFLILLTSESLRKGWLVGLLLGIAFQIKYHVAFDFLAALLIIAAQIGFERTKLRATLREWGSMLLGFLLPLLGVAASFLIVGHFQEYVRSALWANLIYVAGSNATVGHALTVLKDQILAHPLLWLSSILVGLELILERRETARYKPYILIWLALGLVGVLATRRFWDHYFLQVLPAMCLLTAYTVHGILKHDMTRLQRIAILTVILLATPMLGPIRENLNAAAEVVYQRFIERTDEWRDTPLRIAEYLDERTEASDYIYVADDQPVIYFLVDAQCPTRFPFPDHLTNPDLTGMTGTDPVAELHAIMAKSPRYVVRRRDPEHAPSPFYTALDECLAYGYVYETSFQDGAVELYRLTGAMP
jgi:4-amino-4-deoxy-L-arabinose transferase-like glycosyltransferase